MYLTRIAGIEPYADKDADWVRVMYLTRIAGIEPVFGYGACFTCSKMYLTRIAGIEPLELSS